MSKLHNNFIMIISTIVLGFAAGTGSLILSVFLDFIEGLFLNFNETAINPYSVMISPTHRLLSLIIGGMIVTIIWWIIQAHKKTYIGIHQALEGHNMPVLLTILNVLTQIFFVAIGGSVGRELAPRELGAMIAQIWQRLLKKLHHIELTNDDRRLLISSTAGAGFAGAYIAPITGTMFFLELLYKKVNGRSVAVSLTMSSISVFIVSLLKGFHPYYMVSNKMFSSMSILMVLILGPVCGVLGAYFRIAFQWSNRQKTRNNNILWQLPTIAAITGLIAMYFPQIMGNGRALAQSVFMNQSISINLVWLFIIGGIVKSLITILSLRAGAIGGTLTTSLAIGATIGMTLGFAIHIFVNTISISQSGVIGAASLLASSQQAPLMALFMLFEGCHLDNSALLPLGFSVSLAMSASRIILSSKHLQ